MTNFNTTAKNTNTAKNIPTKARLAGSIAAVAIALTACGGAQTSTDSATDSELPAVAEQASVTEQTPTVEQAPATPAEPTDVEAPVVEAPAPAEAPVVESTDANIADATTDTDTASVDVGDREFDDSSAPTNAESANQLIPASSPDFPCVEYVEATELPLFPCSKGDLVVQLQHDLQWNGTPHTVDGYFGEDTYLALQNMQNAWGMYPTGIMDQAMETVISYIYSH